MFSLKLIDFKNLKVIFQQNLYFWLVICKKIIFNKTDFVKEEQLGICTWRT